MGECILPKRGGKSATLIEKSITENGTYTASNDNADGYAKVVVNVSGGGGLVSDVDPLYWRQTSRSSYELLVMPFAIEDVNIVASAVQGEEGLEITLEA